MRQLLVVSGVSAFLGASLIGYKSIAILATGNQPDHVFESSPFFFGLSALTLVYAVMREMRRPRWLLATLGWLAALAGASAAIAHFALQADERGALLYFVNVVSTVVLFFVIGGDIRRLGLLGVWSFAPTLLAWISVLAIPIGGVLESLDERLLEITLLGIAAAWAILGVGVVTARPPAQAELANA